MNMRRFLLLLVLLGLWQPQLARAQNCTSNPGLCNLTVQSTINQPDLDVAIDVVIVGDGFLTSADFLSVANSAIAQFQSAPANIPGRVAGLFNFHLIPVISASTNVGNADLTDTALGMNVSGPFINADMARVNLAALNAPDVDVVITIANSGSGRANANYNSQLASGGAVRLSGAVNVLSHELGHALFHLSDEYEESGLCTGAPSESVMLAEANATAEGSCYKFQGLPGASCIQGNRYCSTGAWRSASTCMMRTNFGAPCPACDHEINTVLAERRTRSDLAPPWVITNRVGQNGVASGVINLVASAHDDFYLPIDIAFEIDGAYVGSQSASFGSAFLSYDTAQLADGTHSLVAYASDAEGHASASLAQSFTVSNATDTTPPTVAFQSPTQGANLSGKTPIFVATTGQTSDIAEIRLFIDSVPVAVSVATSNLFYQWDTSAVAPGLHHLEATAIDSSQNSADATPIDVHTSTSAVMPPTLSATILNPTDGSAVAPYFILQWLASAGGEGGGVSGQGGGAPVSSALVLDNVELTPNPLAGVPGNGFFEAVIDASRWTLGLHQLRVRARLGAQSVDSAPVVVSRGSISTPVVFFRGPPANAQISGPIVASLVAADDVAITSITVSNNGVTAGTITGGSGTLSIPTPAGAAACVNLSAEALSSDGGRASAGPRTVCYDNALPSISFAYPVNGALVPPGLLVVRLSVDDVGSGVVDVELSVDGGAALHTSQVSGRMAGLFTTLTAGTHSLSAAATDRAGNRSTTGPISITVGACTAQSCDDHDACTTDRCAPSGACVHAQNGICCTTAADCNDGDACTVDSCSNGSCAHASTAGCCNHDFDCNDGDACTQDQCSGPGGTCTHPSAGCCSTAADCNDGNSCTTDSCVGNACAHDRTPGCCTAVADCDDGDPCTADSCQNGSCGHSAITACCRSGADCGDGNSCTQDLCNAQHQCENPHINGCCVTSADCATLNPCAQGTCSARGQCSYAPVAGCCNFGFECDDAVVCTDDSCTMNHCTNTSSPICCMGPADCVDGDSCTADLCTQNRCQNPAIAGCGDAGVPPDDAGVGQDAAEAPDAGPGADAAETPDAGAGVDAAEVPDAGPGADAAEPLDLGFGPDATEVLDAGPGADAAEPLDLGFGSDASAAPDAMASADAAMAGDAALAQDAAGLGGTGGLTGSCSCDAAQESGRGMPASLAALALLGWARARGRRERRPVPPRRASS
ncbi:MAG: Ig-like domain-containing protein [Myxococcota bacterium]